MLYSTASLSLNLAVFLQVLLDENTHVVHQRKLQVRGCSQTLRRKRYSRQPNGLPLPPYKLRCLLYWFQTTISTRQSISRMRHRRYILNSRSSLLPQILLLSTSGGEDLFEFLDERVPATPVIPPAPTVAAAPIAAPTPIAESREPYGYTAPVFFPFGKPEPTAPQLKLSGVSSFKKINRCGRCGYSWLTRGLLVDLIYVVVSSLDVLQRVAISHEKATRR